MDAGYNVTRLAYLLAGLPVVVVARVRSYRVFYAPAPPRDPAVPGRVPRHRRAAVKCGDPAGQDGAALALDADAARRGPARVTAWHRVHPGADRGPSGGWRTVRPARSSRSSRAP